MGEANDTAVCKFPTQTPSVGLIEYNIRSRVADYVMLEQVQVVDALLERGAIEVHALSLRRRESVLRRHLSPG